MASHPSHEHWNAKEVNNEPSIVSEEACDETDSIRKLFQKASEYLKPGPLFRWVVYLYSERKMLVFFLVHFVCTMTVWFHFALIKFGEQKASVPEAAPHYWSKRIVPSLEFGSMHAMLFQMALLPLTMSRFSISALSETVLHSFVPFNRSLQMHIHLGYTMTLIVFLSTVVFFGFFGFLCANGEPDFCAKFRSEIMCTGYGIFAALMIVAGTSYFRHSKMPYEVFYLVHHIVFALYAITVAHTIDDVQRNNLRQRSQTFVWFSASILYYVCDRTNMFLGHKYQARLLSSSAISGSNGTRMLILKLKRPTLFQFKPGQYAFLKSSRLDLHWHPFSIASDPASDILEFYVEVFSNKSWTGRLWNLVDGDGEGGVSHRQIDIEIMGPYGTRLANLSEYSHGLAIGTGTGIVPVLSLFKQHVRRLSRFAPEAHMRELCQQERKLFEIEMAEEERSRSLAGQLFGRKGSSKEYFALRHETHWDSVRESIRSSIAVREEFTDLYNHRLLRVNLKDIRRSVFRASRAVYGVVLMSILPVLGVTLLALTISWNTVDSEFSDRLLHVLQMASITFQAIFALVVFTVWDVNNFYAYLDIAVCVVAPFANWYWMKKYDRNHILRPGDIATCCLLLGYMTLRFWSKTVTCGQRPTRTRVAGGEEPRTLEKLRVVWVTRSASLVSEIIPDIDEIWNLLINAWGEENAKAVCEIEVHVTDPDFRQVAVLQRELRDTLLFSSGCIRFGRPDFGMIIEDHLVEMISTRRNSQSVLAYVGSADLAREIHALKISSEMVTAITGHRNHQIDFVSETYGGTKPTKTTMALAFQDIESRDHQTDTIEEDNSRRLTTRRVTSYGLGASHFTFKRVHG